MTKPKYTPEERKLVMVENLKKNKERAEAKGYTQKSAARESAIEKVEKKEETKKTVKEEKSKTKSKK